MSDVILCNLSDALTTIEEAKKEWLHETLLALGISEEVLAIKDSRQFRHELSYNLGVEVELKANGEIDVYKKQWHADKIEELQGWLPTKKENLVAQWKEPKRIRRIENKEVYYEIHLSEWSAFRRK